MDFSIECQCGQTLRVTTADAGGTKPCGCGRATLVPSLGELRRRAGQDPYDTNIVDKIRRLTSDGKLPISTDCAHCGTRTVNVLHCSIECERPYAKSRGFWASVLLGLVAPLWAFRAFNREYSNPEVHGREIVVDTPLRLCSDCAAVVRKRTRLLCKLLRSEPLYDQLLQEYPDAGIGMPLL